MNYTVVNFSGGKDSTAMLLHMIELGDHIDEVINIDVGMEFPAMYDHIGMVKKIVEKEGIKYTTLKSQYSFEYWMLEKPIKSKYGDHIGYGWPSINCRWCTSEMKVKVSRAHFKELKQQGYKIIQCIGLAADEYKRLERPNNRSVDHRHPLVEWGWSEKDALSYCKKLGFTWGGLYDLFSRVSCWCCPFSGLNELRTLWANFPELWRKLEEWENRMSPENVGRKFSFKDETSVFDLSKRFAYEKDRMDRGLSIDTPGFYQTYRRLREELPNGQTTLQKWDVIE